MPKISNPLAFRAITGAEDFTPEQMRVRERAKAIGAKIVEEGCVLLKNDGLLPLQTAKVNVFGVLAARPYLGGRGSSCADNSRAVGFYTALEETGISFNPALYALYKNWAKKGMVSEKPYPPERTTPKFKKSSVVSTIIEVFSKPYWKELPARALTDARMAQAKGYSDTAIVMLGRSGSEQHDMTPAELGLLPGERAMLERVCRSFDKVVLILNTAGVFELGFLQEFPSIRAVLSIGYPARTGMHSVARLLKGGRTPPGGWWIPFTITRQTTQPGPTWEHIGTQI